MFSSVLGLYDQTLLNFSKVDSRLEIGQISGEIYVEKGLERALKVDRESFHETDPHYLVLQDHIWKELRAISSSVIEVDNATLQKMVANEVPVDEGLDQLARHRTDIGPAMPFDFCFITHATQAEAIKFSAQSFSD